jgi:hypothetical protein
MGNLASMRQLVFRSNLFAVRICNLLEKKLTVTRRLSKVSPVNLDPGLIYFHISLFTLLSKLSKLYPYKTSFLSMLTTHVFLLPCI